MKFIKKKHLKKSTLVVVIISQLLLCFSATSFATSFGTNLVINGDAETGNTTGWTASGNVAAFVVAEAYFGAEVQAIHGKVLELYDGSPNVETTFSQTINISDIQSTVATGLVSLDFSVEAYSWFGTTVSYTVEELDVSDNVLSTHTSGIVNLFSQATNYLTDPLTCTWTTTSIAVANLNTGTAKLRISVYGKTSPTQEDFVDFDNIQLSLSTVPSVITTTISISNATSATMGGNVTADNGSTVTERGVIYSTTDATPTIGESGVIIDPNGSGTGIFSESIASLSAGTTYYVRAYAISTAGIGYGNIISFLIPITPTITWNNPSDITYGTLLSATQLNATANTPGTFTYTPALGAKLNTGAEQTLKVDFTPTDLINYEVISKTVTINVTKATPIITWSNPENITFGTPLSATQLNAEADVDGSFIYTPDFGTILSVGDGQNLQADFIPTDTDNYISTSKTVLINIVLGTNILETNRDVLMLYPNPVIDNFVVAGLQSAADITVSDLKGLSILSKRISIGEYVSVQNLSKGIYIVQIVTNGKTYNMQLIKK